MSDKALPIVFLNLSGEMIYVIQQRLEAQNISDDKSKKVIQDIVGTMLNEQFIDELFKPQNMYSRSALLCVYEKLVHSSIMRLNNNSMNKLYDLMLMVFKYQFFNCENPEDVLLVTMNHFDAIKNCAIVYPELNKKIQYVHSLLLKNYKDMIHEDFEVLHNCIAKFLENLNIKVSVLMKLGLQLPNGDIVLSSKSKDCYIQDKIYQVDKTRKIISENNLAIDGDRGTLLGKNIYIKSSLEISNNTYSDTVIGEEKYNENAHALEEITLLGRLIGKSAQTDFIPDIMCSSLDDAAESCQISGVKDESCSFVNIDASLVCKKELGNISNEFDLEVKKKERNDILELLDTAE